MKYILFFTLLFSLSAWGADATKTRYSDREDVRIFIKKLVDEHEFNRAELMKLFREVKHQKSVIEAYKRPAERALSWKQYRKIFVKPGRIQLGAQFWQTHADSLKQASKATGVPEELIVAIIGVETRFGRYKGKNPVLDSLTTLAFDREKRKDFFRRELEEFLLLCREQSLDPTKIKGSYAGAMGMPQFIASSYRMYAVDGDNDKKIDLFNSHDDVIASVANYFKRHGWKQGQPVVTKAAVNQPEKIKSKVVGKGRKELKPDVPWKEYKSQGVKIGEDAALDKDTPTVLMWFDDEAKGAYWLGYNNFYAITRYNHSTMYALAAHQLSQEIKAEYAKHNTQKKKPAVSNATVVKSNTASATVAQ